MIIFEISPHPEYSERRALSTVDRMDSMIHVMDLTVMDIDNPNSSVFPDGMAPVVPYQAPAAFGVSVLLFLKIYSDSTLWLQEEEEPSSCGCESGNGLLISTSWDDSWPDSVINQTLARQLCWIT